MSITNRRANFNYQIVEKLEAGIVLTGSEPKAIRLGSVSLDQAHAKIISGEIFLINASITIPGKLNYDPSRTRKLLLHRKEILALEAKIKGQKLALVPLKLYNSKGHIKVELGLGKPKRQFDKKDTLKARDIKRDTERDLVD